MRNMKNIIIPSTIAIDFEKYTGLEKSLVNVKDRQLMAADCSLVVE